MLTFLYHIAQALGLTYFKRVRLYLGGCWTLWVYSGRTVWRRNVSYFMPYTPYAPFVIQEEDYTVRELINGNFY